MAIRKIVAALVDAPMVTAQKAVRRSDVGTILFQLLLGDLMTSGVNDDGSRA